MTWLAWRQFRANAVLAILFTVVVVVVLIATRGHVAHIADPDKLSTGYKSLRLLGTALIGIPAFIGGFWGAPLLAHELETGTHRLAWTQPSPAGAGSPPSSPSPAWPWSRSPRHSVSCSPGGHSPSIASSVIASAPRTSASVVLSPSRTPCSHSRLARSPAP